MAPVVHVEPGGSVFPAVLARMMTGSPVASGSRGAATSTLTVTGGIDCVLSALTSRTSTGAPAAVETRGAVTTVLAVADGTSGVVSRCVGG